MSKTKSYKLVGGFVTLAVVAMLVGVVSVHADDSSNGNGKSQGVLLPPQANITNPSAVLSTEGETHGSIVSQVAKGLGVSGEQRTQPSVSMDVNGNFSVTGVSVQSVDAAANTVTVSFYGFTRTVNLAGVPITGGGQNMTISAIQTGDILSARGTYNSSTHSITVASVVDVSTQNANTANIQAQINHLMQLLAALEAQVQGTNASTTTSSN